MGQLLIAACVGLMVVAGGAALLMGPDLLDWWPLLEADRPTAGGQGVAAESRSETARLVFLAADGQTLQEETRAVKLPTSLPAAARAILEELLAGSHRGLGAVLPAGARIRQVFVDKRGVAYVDLSPEILGDSAAADPWAPVVRAALAVAASLGMSLPEIAQVQVLVDGREVPVVADDLDLRRPLPALLPIGSPDLTPPE